MNSSYPYKGFSITCNFNPSMPTVNCDGYDVDNFQLYGDENALLVLVRDYGPVPVGIQITPLLTLYKSGIFYDPSCNGEPNHAVLVTGYGTQNGQDYW